MVEVEASNNNFVQSVSKIGWFVTACKLGRRPVTVWMLRRDVVASKQRNTDCNNCNMSAGTKNVFKSEYF